MNVAHKMVVFLALDENDNISMTFNEYILNVILKICTSNSSKFKSIKVQKD